VSYRVAVIAGEASGDMHGAALAQNLRSLDPDIVLEGIGGERMRDAGVRTWHDPTRLSAVGLVEVLGKIVTFKRLFDATLKSIIEMRADVVVLIDYSGFNMRLGERLHALGIRCVYFIPPTAWAWGRKRANKVAAFADKVLSIFPFEVDVYKGAGADVEFVGHPLLDQIDRTSVSEGGRTTREGTRVLGLFPGSRGQEVDALLPTMLQSARLILERFSDVEIELSVAPTVDRSRVVKHVSDSGLSVRFHTGNATSLMQRCFCGVVASGTATLEAALIGMPMVIVYKVSRLTAAIYRRLITVPSVGLPNIILGRRGVPELIQEDFTPVRVADEVIRYCSDSEYYDQVVSDLASIRGLLGEPGAARRAAEAVLSVVRGGNGEVAGRIEA